MTAEPQASPARRRGSRLTTVAFGAAGVILAVWVAARVPVHVGPFDTTFSARPSFVGETVVRLAPLGTIRLDSHDVPVAVDIRVDELRIDEAEEIARDPSVLRRLQDDLASDVRSGLRALAVRSSLVALLGGALGALVGTFAWRAALMGAAVAAILAVVVSTVAAVTYRPEAIREPRYTGLLTVAPRAVGDVESIVERFGEYRAQLANLVGNVVALYRAAQNLPTFDPAEDDTVKLLHVSDIHKNPQAFDLIRLAVDQFEVDAVVDTGDITDWGTDLESRLLRQIGRLDVPYVWIRGNHDSRRTQAAVAGQPNAMVLDGTAATIAGLRLWGIGDPRYTPDKGEPTGKDAERDAAARFAPRVARRLRAAQPPKVDVLLVHDARMAAAVDRLVPLVLAGHYHEAEERSLDGTTVLIEGSTGGAGLRSLKGDDPEPLTCSVLYFGGPDDRLVAYDRLTVRGLGGTAARIERHLVEEPERE